MSKFDIEDEYYNQVLLILQNYLPDFTYYIFGSRAKGTNSKYSDIDIAVSGKNKVSFDTLAAINSEFEKSLIPYEIDIIDLNSISESFKASIQNSLIQF